MKILLFLLFSTSVFSAERIVSLTPATTEIIYKLGHFNDVVGVTDFCRYPAESTNKVKLGGLYNLKYEELIKLHPSLILIDDSSGDRQKDIRKLKFRIEVLAYKKLNDIFKSIEDIGAFLQESPKAVKIVNDLKNLITKNKNLLKSKNVLIVIGENAKKGEPNDLLIPGGGTFYSELIESLGGKNIFYGINGYQNISHDLLKTKKIDYVVHITAENKNVYEKFWQDKYHVKAIILNDGKYFIPGIRFFDIIDEIKKNVRN
jgi:iron complex transport system substrate-binding protein